jgi:hypothetical protein
MVQRATAGSTIYVPDGVYSEDQFDIDKALTITAQNGAENVIINMLGNGIGITADNVVIDGVTITSDGATTLLNVGKSVSGTIVEVEDCVVQNCVLDGDGIANGVYFAALNDVNLYSNKIMECPNGVIVSSSVLNLNLIDNDIFNNTCGVRVLGAVSQVMLISNGIYWNTSYGLVNSSSASLNAENNFWGTESGPYHSMLNTAGTGNKVSGNVDFDPYFAGCSDDRWHICPDGDMNGDCKIDYADLAIIAQSWLICNGPNCP